MMTVGKLMKTRVVTARQKTTAREALILMTEAGVRHLPVVDERGWLLGLVSQLDVVRALDLGHAARGARGESLLGEVMSVAVFRTTPEQPAQNAAALMIEHKIGALPVVDGDGRVIGIVSETDFLEVARESLAGVNFEARAQA